MNIKEFAAQLKETVKSIKDKQGIEVIKCDNLIAYLEEIIKSPQAEIDQATLEKYKAELQIWVEQNKNQHDWSVEMFRSVILSGQNALSSAFLMNGGATVALLAFLGKLSEQHQGKMAAFSHSLLMFVVGVFFVVLASGFTYLTQWCYSEYKFKNLGYVLHVSVVIFCLVSYGFFIWGSFVAYRAFVGFN